MNAADKFRERFWTGDESRPKDDGFVDHLYLELLNAIQKHGMDQTPLNPKMDVGEKLAILVEEIGEVADVAPQGDSRLQLMMGQLGAVARALTYDEGSPEKLRQELIQVAAMSAAWFISLEE